MIKRVINIFLLRLLMFVCSLSVGPCGLFMIAAKAQQPTLILPIGHTEDIFLTKFVGEGKYIITCAYDNTAKLWDVYSGRLLHTFPNRVPYISHDGKYQIGRASCRERV